MREEAAVIGYQMEAGCIAVQRLTAAKEDGTDDRKITIASTFTSANQNSISANHFTPIMFMVPTIAGAKRKDPLRDIAKRAPVVHIQRNGSDIDDTGHRPVNEVHPASDVGGFFTEKFAGVRDKAAAGRAMQYQFAQRAKNEEGEDPAHQIDEGESRASHLQTCTST